MGTERQFEMTRSGDQPVNAGRGHPDLPVANRAQVAFHLVRECFRFPVLHHRRDALDRMKTTKELFGHGRIRAGLPDPAFERQERAAYRRQMLLAFGVVVVQEAVEELVAHHALTVSPSPPASSFRTSRPSASGENGFVRYADAPAFSAAARLSSSPRVVSTAMGTLRYFACERTNWSTSSPCMSGMFRSRRISPMEPTARRSIACRPVSASRNSTVGKNRARAARTIRRIVGESSTTRICCISSCALGAFAAPEGNVTISCGRASCGGLPHG